MNAHRTLTWFFWFAFGAFLAASIPHVAYFFRAYEPLEPAKDWLWWTVSFGIAISIDVTIFLLSMTVASLHRQKSSRGLICSVWIFIIGLALLSWYINYKYAQHFMDTHMISATSIVIPLWDKKIADINPAIASMFQALAIAYTWIADKIAADEKPKTVEELQKEADELESRAQHQARIDKLRREQSSRKWQGIFGDMQEWKEGISTVISGSKTDDSSVHTAPINQPDIADTQSDSEGMDTVSPSCTHNHNESIEQSQTGVLEHAKSASNGSTSRVYVPIEEAVELLQYDLSYVKTLRTKGVLRTSGKNPDLISVASINAVLSKKQKDTVKQSKVVSINRDRDTDELGISQLILQSHAIDTPVELSAIQADTCQGDELDLSVKALEENPAITNS